KEDFIRDIKERLEGKPDILVTISEGIKDKNGKYVSDQTSSKAVDSFGHKQIAGAAKVLEKFIVDNIGCKTRTVELSLMQRASAHIASDTDVKESLQLGHKALTCALNRETGKMVAIKRLGDEPYRIEYVSVPVEMVANHEKKVPLQWITDDGHDVTEEMIAYLKPLIQGEAHIKYENGIPRQTITI
ncbi:MAG TPA: 6-phosphofructokinase, partial [Clostridiales bacterium]|nr:6-phosphofructokinase [Clostridiales bacterium]